MLGFAYSTVPFKSRAEAVLTLGYGRLANVPGKIRYTTKLIEVNVAGKIATVENDSLARLVIAAHNHCVRLQISAGGGRIKLQLTDRSRDQHPTIEDAIKRVRTDSI